MMSKHGDKPMFFSAQPIDSQFPIDRQFGINESSKFLVITWKPKDKEYLCIISRLGPYTPQGSPFTKNIWTVLDESHCDPKIKLPPEYIAISSKSITEVHGQFATLDEARLFFDAYNEPDWSFVPSSIGI